MFDEHGLAVVTDFGIAKAATGGKLTGTGMSIGTPHYMSPEQARAQQLDGRSDIYSLGVVAFESLTGNVPFDGEDSFSIGYKHIMEELAAPPLETHEQRSLFEIIRKMMAKAPDDRFQTADELVGALQAGPGPPGGGRSATPPPGTPSRPPARPSPSPSRQPRGRRHGSRHGAMRTAPRRRRLRRRRSRHRAIRTPPRRRRLRRRWSRRRAIRTPLRWRRPPWRRERPAASRWRVYRAAPASP